MAETQLTPTHYYDGDLDTGLDDGSDWANAFQTLQKAADTVTAGSIVACQGDETITSRIDIDTNFSTYGNPIIFQGGYSGGVWDGTSMARINGGGTSTNILYFSGTTGYVCFDLFDFDNPSTVVILNSNSDYIQFSRCKIHNGTIGYSGSNETATFYNCMFSDLSSGAITSSGINTRIIGCYIKDITGIALSLNTTSHVVIGNLIHNCTSHGISVPRPASHIIMGNTIDGAGGSAINIVGYTDFNPVIVMYNLLTNSAAYGITATSTAFVQGDYNSFYNNTSGEKNILGAYFTGGNDVTIASDPYNDRASDDFNVVDSSIIRLPIGVGLDATNINNLTLGAMQPEASGGGGGATLGAFENGMWR